MIAVALAGCADVAEPYELDHARVIAVRVDPPAIAAGQTARVDVLVTDAAGGPREATPDAMTVTAPPSLVVTRDDSGWYVEAATAEPSIATLAITASSAVGSLVADKTVELGASRANPPAAAIVHDGILGDLTIVAGRDVELAPDPASAPGDDSISYRWFSSVGELVGYTRADAELTPVPGSTGAIGLVVRDQQGGTAWSFASVVVAP